MRNCSSRWGPGLEQEGPTLCCAYRLGSRARGDGRGNSGVDVAVPFVIDPPQTLTGLDLDLADRRSAAVGGGRTDRAVLNQAPVDLIHRVLRDGLPLLERNRSTHIRSEVRARNEYVDLLPHLHRYRHLGPHPTNRE